MGGSRWVHFLYNQRGNAVLINEIKERLLDTFHFLFRPFSFEHFDSPIDQIGAMENGKSDVFGPRINRKNVNFFLFHMIIDPD